jgi:hypothetical protein
MYEKGMARIEKDYWGGSDSDLIELPHSCDSWVIGGVKEVRTLIADLEELIAKLEEKSN